MCRLFTIIVLAVALLTGSCRETSDIVDNGKNGPVVVAYVSGGQGKPLPDWLSILILGSPVILLGLIIMAVTERIKRRSYRLPVEWTETEPATETTKKEGEKEHET